MPSMTVAKAEEAPGMKSSKDLHVVILIGFVNATEEHKLKATACWQIQYPYIPEYYNMCSSHKAYK